jgi:hypothetical protein
MMKTVLRLLVILTIGVSLSSAQTMPPTGLKGYWKFDDPANLGKAEVGNPLLMKHMITAEGDANKFLAVTGPVFGNNAVTVGLGSYFECTPDLPANGGDSATMVNQWTIAMDFRVRTLEWHAFCQTDPSTYQDTIKDGLGNPTRIGPRFTGDADLFSRPSGTIGVAASGYSYESIEVDKWYRLVVTADLGAHDFRIYLDGQLMQVGPSGGFNLDNRFAIQSIDGMNKLILLGDDDGDDGEMDVAFIALYNRPLTAAEVEGWDGYGTPVRTEFPAGQWDFDITATPLKATVGKDLGLNGSDAPVEGPSGEDKARQIASGNSYTVSSSVLPNGGTGATRTNLYAMKIDFRVTSFAKPHPLYQSDSTNANGAELFINTDGFVGSSALGYSNDAVTLGKWHRLIVNADPAATYELWLDGAPLMRKAAQAVDGRYSLGPKGTVKSFLMFADSATYSGSTLDVAGFTLWNRTLDSLEIVEMGEVPVTASDTTSGPGGFSVFGDGSTKNQYGRVATHSDFDFDSTKSFSIELWTKATMFWTSDPSIIADKNWESGGFPGWVISADEGRNRTWKFNLADEYGNRVDINMNNDAAAGLNDGRWHHIAVTVDQTANVATAYADGKFVRSSIMDHLKGSVRGRDPNNTSHFYPLCIGQDGTENYVYSNGYPGYIDEVRIWNGIALDSLTILAWKNKMVTASHPYYSSLVGYWKFDEGSGTTSADGSGKGHTVTLMNGMAWRTSLAFTDVAPVDRGVPTGYELANAFPNPFNPSTTIRFALPFASTVKLEVFNLLGQRVATLVDGGMAAGYHEVQWNALTGQRMVASGVYFYRLDATASTGVRFIDTKKIVLVK